MKKVFFAVVFAGMTAMCAQAQLFLGGSFGVGFTASSVTSGSTTTNDDAYLLLELCPMMGYNVSDKLAIGGQVHFGIISSNDRESKPTTGLGIVYGISPFVRNTLVSSGNLSLLLESGISILGASTKNSYEGTSVDGPTALQFGVSAMPVLSYSLTNKLSLEARPNILRVALGISTLTYNKGRDNERTYSDTYFGLGINPSSISAVVEEEDLFQTAPLQIGMIFKF